MKKYTKKNPYDFKLYHGQKATFTIGKQPTQLEDLKKINPRLPLHSLHCWLCKTSFLHKNPTKKYCSLKCRGDMAEIRANLAAGKSFIEDVS